MLIAQREGGKSALLIFRLSLLSGALLQKRHITLQRMEHGLHLLEGHLLQQPLHRFDGVLHIISLMLIRGPQALLGRVEIENLAVVRGVLPCDQILGHEPAHRLAGSAHRPAPGGGQTGDRGAGVVADVGKKVGLQHGQLHLGGVVVAHIDVVIVAQDELVDDVHLLVQHLEGAVELLLGHTLHIPIFRRV